MGQVFHPYEPDQALMFPPAVRDWVSEGHFAHFVSDSVDELDLRMLGMALLWTGAGRGLTLATVRPSEAELCQWTEEFEAASRRTLRERMRYAFIRTHKPVLDDEPYRSFDSTEEYRRWCAENLPSWLGYGPSV